jgi:hypothetical protein
MKFVLGLLALLPLACEPPVAKPVAIVDTSGPPARAEACRDDVPDCVAACALRETRRMEFVDFYERRCAAVVLGKNPDKVDLMPTPYASAAAGDAGAVEFPPDYRGSLSMQPTPSTFDPNSMSRTGGTEPPECKAARMLRAQKRDREADMLSALCIAKGGDAGS